jgi:hypothetical protein
MQVRSFICLALIVVAPVGCSQPLQPDHAGSGGTGDSATGTGGLSGNAGAAPGPDGATGCTTVQVPPEVQPLAPTAGAASTCATIATSAATWSPPTNPSGNTTDARGSVVGRWVPCGVSVFTSVPHAAVEFGANGRWQLLTIDATGALVPMAAATTGARGTYYALGTGPLDVMHDENPNVMSVTFVSFASGMDAIAFQQAPNPASAPLAAYARIAASPLNGSDNPPPITDGQCSMVGTWDGPTGGVGPAPAFSFDGAGNFAMELASSVRCDATASGTYALSAAGFQITANTGGCPWWYGAGYSAVFDGTCSQVTLTPLWDNCTGGRTYLIGTNVLTRRQIPSLE